jgi:CxxC-x17-CxxC domain-containing protein
MSFSLYTDKTLTCRDCGQQFIFTAGEQEFYAEKGFTNEPTRCPDCRSARKASRAGGDTYSARSGGGSYGAPRQDRGEREMHPAVCSNCGRDTMVPFVPTSGKPVYCQECFRAQRDQRSYSNRW